MKVFPLQNQIAVVTGAGKGIGKAIAERLAADGAHIAILDLDGDSAKAAADQIKMDGRQTIGLSVDVADHDAVASAFQEIEVQLGPPDILVNNAGIFTGGPLLDISPDVWHRTIETNLTGAFFCAQAIAPYLMQKKAGRIINIASISAKRSWPESHAYSASKTGLIGLTRALAHDMAPYNVTVNAVCPGDTRTDMLTEVDRLVSEAEGQIPGTFFDAAPTRIPLGRFAEPTEIAALVAFLASPDAGYITGQAINIDGGRVMN